MVEDRDGAGRRKQAFYSASVSRNGDGPVAGWSLQEARLASCLLSRHVVETTYRDALKRRVLPKEVVATELPGILEAYDTNIVSLMANGADEGAKGAT